MTTTSAPVIQYSGKSIWTIALVVNPLIPVMVGDALALDCVQVRVFTRRLIEMTVDGINASSRTWDRCLRVSLASRDGVKFNPARAGTAYVSKTKITLIDEPDGTVKLSVHRGQGQGSGVREATHYSGEEGSLEIRCFAPMLYLSFYTCWWWL